MSHRGQIGVEFFFSFIFFFLFVIFFVIVFVPSSSSSSFSFLLFLFFFFFFFFFFSFFFFFFSSSSSSFLSSSSSSSSYSLPLSMCSLLSLFFFSSFFSSPLFSSSCYPYCYSCSSIFVDSFLADVDECTSSTPVCSIHFNCINTLGSYRCDHNHSCQGRKAVNYLFLFLIGQLNSFEAR